MNNVLYADKNVFNAESVNFYELARTIQRFIQYCLISLIKETIFAHESKTKRVFFYIAVSSGSA